MKFLKENNLYKIRINKYHKDDFVLTPKGVYIFAKDVNSHKLRLPPLKTKKHFIIKDQIARYEDYLYIPDDQIPKEDNLIHEYTRPLESKVFEKWKWKAFKDKYIYKQ